MNYDENSEDDGDSASQYVIPESQDQIEFLVKTLTKKPDRSFPSTMIRLIIHSLIGAVSITQIRQFLLYLKKEVPELKDIDVPSRGFIHSVKYSLDYLLDQQAYKFVEGGILQSYSVLLNVRFLSCFFRGQAPNNRY